MPLISWHYVWTMTAAKLLYRNLHCDDFKCSIAWRVDLVHDAVKERTHEYVDKEV